MHARLPALTVWKDFGYFKRYRAATRHRVDFFSHFWIESFMCAVSTFFISRKRWRLKISIKFHRVSTFGESALSLLHAKTRFFLLSPINDHFLILILRTTFPFPLIDQFLVINHLSYFNHISPYVGSFYLSTDTFTWSNQFHIVVYRYALVFSIFN